MVPVAPLWRRSGDFSTHDKVYADHKRALILSNSTVYGSAKYYTPLVRKNSSHTTLCYIGTQHGDGGAGTPRRAGRVGLMCRGETDGMRTRID